MSKKMHTFASDNEEPIGALAFTDFDKPSPILKGKDAERFIRIMEENERKAKEKAKEPMTKEEAETELSYCKIMCQFEEDRLSELRNRIKKLEDYIKNI